MCQLVPKSQRELRTELPVFVVARRLTISFVFCAASFI